MSVSCLFEPARKGREGKGREEGQPANPMGGGCVVASFGLCVRTGTSRHVAQKKSPRVALAGRGSFSPLGKSCVSSWVAEREGWVLLLLFLFFLFMIASDKPARLATPLPPKPITKIKTHLQGLEARRAAGAPLSPPHTHVGRASEHAGQHTGCRESK